ncbi:testis-expressed protein 47 [Biomphalaria pfeifferi]|uniref:Testis-expressed protein 47 n=1 Tax=Biomphalaria pfeifferi TaxID=112525 RepID=A0AAD8F493_BIOPF|nr:testis-expressed protein 47 [Biomphalaria pfeifferi]
MASEEERVSPSQDSNRTTLLDVIEERNRHLNKKYLIHRLVYISKLSSPGVDRTALGTYYDTFIKKLQTDFPGSEAITGLMLIYPKHVVHVIETSSDLILKLIEDLHRLEKETVSLVSKTLDIVEHGIESFDTKETFENLIVELLIQLLKLGAYLHKQPKLNLKNAMDSLHEKVSDLLPQQSVVHYLLEENDSSMMTPLEFIDLYRKPFDTYLESDMVWPIPTRLFPYN